MELYACPTFLFHSTLVIFERSIQFDQSITTFESFQTNVTIFTYENITISAIETFITCKRRSANQLCCFFFSFFFSFLVQGFGFWIPDRSFQFCRFFGICQFSEKRWPHKEIVKKDTIKTTVQLFCQLKNNRFNWTEFSCFLSSQCKCRIHEDSLSLGHIQTTF